MVTNFVLNCSETTRLFYNFFKFGEFVKILFGRDIESVIYSVGLI